MSTISVTTTSSRKTTISGESRTTSAYGVRTNTFGPNPGKTIGSTGGTSNLQDGTGYDIVADQFIFDLSELQELP